MIQNLILCSILSLSLAATYDSGQWYSILQRGKNLTIVRGKNVSGSLAWGVYLNETFIDGWGKLTLNAVNFSSKDVAYAAGYLQGALEYNYTYFHKLSFFDSFYGSQTVDSNIISFANKQYAFIKTQVAANDDPYWNTMGYWISFYEGMVNGYNQAVPKKQKITPQNFLLMQLFGDALELLQRFDSRIPAQSRTRREHLLLGHCSVLIKMTDDMKDVQYNQIIGRFMGHNTWSDGQTMLRTYKFYNFGDDVQFNFAGYPGQLYSGDDWYVLTRPDQKMLVTETSLEVNDPTLLKKIIPQSAFTWQRAMVANVLATSGDEWTQIFSRYNSGTYNDQFIVVDMKQFLPGVGPKTGFIWIAEQMPGLILTRDVTKVALKQGNYWASYNIPYIKTILKYSGSSKLGYDWYGDTRAVIYRRIQKQAQNITGIRTVQRYNDYKNDESDGDPMDTIAARGDLYAKASERVANFAYDAKVTSYSRIFNGNGSCDIQNGPTHDNHKPFRWSDYKFTNVRIGQPDLWNFTWVTVQAQQ